MRTPAWAGVIGLDIGGVHLKAANSEGLISVHAFELWKNPQELSSALEDLLEAFDRIDQLAITMTGELCDCFATKKHGVLHILHAVEQVAGGRPILVWQTDGQFVSLGQARDQPLLAAASNWLALATFIGRFVPSGSALLVDIGSTTTDLIPLVDGVPVPHGRTDPERLRSGELVYTGVRRTPVCAFLGRTGMAELFATSQDVLLCLGLLPEDPDDTRTADGQPATIWHAHCRLSRMLGADGELLDTAATLELAEQVFAEQKRWILAGIQAISQRLPTPVHTWIVSGEGEWLARQVAGEVEPMIQPTPLSLLNLSQRCGTGFSHAACAAALAVLAAEGQSHGG